MDDDEDGLEVIQVQIAQVPEFLTSLGICDEDVAEILKELNITN